MIAALTAAGHEVLAIDPGENLADLVARLTPAPDKVFNALHGRFGENGAIQGVLDWMGIPYTHSGVRASALAMDKAASRAVFAAAGLPIAEGRVIAVADLLDRHPMPAPYVVKPVREGSSVGVHIVQAGDNRRTEIARAWSFGPEALVEEFIPGRELTVGVLDDRALTVTDIVAAEGFYDYRAKYAEGGSRHILPAALPPGVGERAMRIAEQAHAALGCRGATRADFRFDDATGKLVLLEVNTQPGLTPTSLLPEQAAHCGMDFWRCARGCWSARHAARDGPPPRTARPRNSVNDRLGRFALWRRRARKVLRPAAWVTFAAILLLMSAGLVRSAQPGTWLASARARVATAAADAGMRVADVVIEGRANTPEPLLRAAIGVTKVTPCSASRSRPRERGSRRSPGSKARRSSDGCPAPSSSTCRSAARSRSGRTPENSC